MTGRRTLLAAITLAVFAAAGAFYTALRAIEDRQNAALDQSLILTARAVETEIERFRALPAVASEDARIPAAIRAPDDPAAIATANRYLARITEHSGAAQLFLLDSEGTAIAASNYATDQSLVGRNYSFRPYFTEALQQGKGRFYAIGVTTGLPGYFLSTRIKDGPDTGVLVIKVDLTPLQDTWARAGLTTAIADADNVVFLSGAPEWLYRPVAPVSAAALARIRGNRTYDGIDLASATPILTGVAAAPSNKGTMHLRFRPLATEGWTLIAGAARSPITTSAFLWAAAAALLTFVATGLAKIAHQRRQLVALRLRQNSLLETRVAERTRDLAREVAARRKTEAELRAAQEGLIHSEKMAALGRMSTAIVHEISQPLAAMEATLGAAEIALDPGQGKTQTRITTARNLVRRMQRTIRHLKSFSRREQGELSLIDLRQVVENALDLVAPRSRAVGVLPVVLPAAGPVPARAGAVRMEQVVVNLLLNALDAVEGRSGARITVAVRLGGFAQICVSDTGAGIADEDIARVMEPFFSTKISGGGLGLGLSISQAIVGEFGGRIDIASAPGAGTQVTVSLPPAPAERLSAPAGPLSGETV